MLFGKKIRKKRLKNSMKSNEINYSTWMRQ